jgi:outer membrane lipoprotein
MKPTLLLALVALAACARPPQRLAGEFPPIAPADVQQGGHVGEHVRWGGLIVATTPREDETCIEVVSLPLDRRARPRLVDETFGRFRGCVPGFYDPEIYAVDREVTVVGTVEGVERGTVGEQAYDFPRIAAEAVHLWPERPPYAYGPYAMSVYGFYPWYPFWGDVYVVHPRYARPPGPMIHTRPRR